MLLAWGYNVNDALAGRGKEGRDFGVSCLDAPIHEEFVKRDAICLDDDSTTRLEEFVTRDVEGIYFEDNSTTRLGGQRVRSESKA